MFIMLQTYIKLCEYRNVKAKQLHNLRKSTAKHYYIILVILDKQQKRLCRKSVLT